MSSNHVGCINNPWPNVDREVRTLPKFLNDIMSRDFYVIDVTESWVNRPRDLLPLLDGYEKLFFPGRLSNGNRLLILIENKLGFKEKVNSLLIQKVCSSSWTCHISVIRQMDWQQFMHPQQLGNVFSWPGDVSLHVTFINCARRL